MPFTLKVESVHFKTPEFLYFYSLNRTGKLEWKNLEYVSFCFVKEKYKTLQNTLFQVRKKYPKRAKCAG